MVSNQGAQRFSVRHLPHRLRLDHSVTAFVGIWWQADSRPEVLERRTADSRGRTTGSQGQARHTNHGRGADNWLGGDFNFAVGQAVECLRLDSRDRYFAIRGIGFADDYYKMAKQRSLGLTGKQKLLGQLVIAIGVWTVLFILTKYFASDYSWNVSIPFIKATANPTGISFIGPFLYLFFIIIVLLGFSNGVNSDRRFGRPGDKRDLHRDDSFDSPDLSK